MAPSFQTIKTQRPWHKRPGTMAALGVFVILGAAAWFFLKGSEKTLVERVKAHDPVSPYCAYAIGWRGMKEDATRDAFEEVVASGETEKPAPDEVRRACAYALGMAKQKHSVMCLIEALQKDKSVPVRCAAARALGKTQEPLGAEPIMAAIGDKQEADIVIAGADASVFLGDKRAIDRLIDRLDDGNPAIRRACHDALVALTGTSFEGTDEKREWRKWRETH